MGSPAAATWIERLRQPIALPPALSEAGDRVTAAVVLAVEERRFFLRWALGFGVPGSLLAASNLATAPLLSPLVTAARWAGGAVATAVAFRHLHGRRGATGRPEAAARGATARPIDGPHPATATGRTAVQLLAAWVLLELLAILAARGLVFVIPSSLDVLAPVVARLGLLAAFLLVPPLILLEGRSALDAARRSARLLRPRRLAVAVAALVLLGLEIACDSVISSPDTFVLGPAALGELAYGGWAYAYARVLHAGVRSLYLWALLLPMALLVTLSYVVYADPPEPLAESGAGESPVARLLDAPLPPAAPRRR